MQNNASASVGSWMDELAHILRASRQAVTGAKLILAAVGLIATFLLGHTLDWIWVGCGAGVSRATISTGSMMVEVPTQDDPVRGVFAVVMEHEKYCLDQALKAARHFSITDGMGSIWRLLSEHHPKSPRPRPEVGQGYGLIAFILAALYGAYWVLTEHWFFSLVFGLPAIAIWSLFGGGICRIAALQFAKKQRLSAKEALTFAKSRFWHLMLAPLLPFAMVLLLALGLLVGGYFAYVPLLGGALFGLALLCGAVIAGGILIILVGGTNLMWPAVAVEGAECTDAIGRGSNYFLERIERAVVYALVAILYGALVWMVVRLFAFVLVYCVHGIVGTTFSDLHQMWETPTYDRLYSAPAAADQIEGWSDNFTFLLIRTWVSLGGFVLYGFLASYYFTCSTTIYFLLRSRVDENELDDVYVETPEPALGPTPASTSASTTTAGSAGPAPD